jgi:anti-anti-sigma factor
MRTLGRVRAIQTCDGRLRDLSADPVTETDVQPLQPPESFRCDVRIDGEASWVRPIGELDLDTASLLEHELSAARGAGADRLVLDMRELTFMDSTGLRLVIRWDTAAEEEGFEFAIVPGSEVVQRVFRLTGMQEHLKVAEPPPDS